MIVPQDELQDLQRYGVVPVVVTDDPPPIGTVMWVRPSPRSRPACQARVSDSYPVEGGHEVLLEKVAPEFHIPVQRERPDRRSSELRLSREQRAAVLADEPATELVFDEEPKVEEGGSYVLVWSRPAKVLVRDDRGQVVGVFHPEPEPLVTVKVTTKVRRAKGGWTVSITVTDARPRLRFVRRVPPALEPEVMKADRQRATGPDEDDIVDARHEGAYTTSHHGAVDDQEAIDWEDRNADLRASQQKLLEDAIRGRLSLGGQLDSLLADADEYRNSKHIRDRVRKIEREIDALKRDVRGDRQAA